MIPVYLDPNALNIALIGRGALAARRLHWLREGGAVPDVWSDASADDLPATHNRLPDREALARYQVVWIAGLQPDETGAIAVAARDAGALVNSEDQIELCDFHTPAIVRRGKLTLAAGTGGASPAVARAARERLEEAFPQTWEAALDDIARARAVLRDDGASFDVLIADARARLAQHGLG
jgi:precorrin-2 dehydrogenase/sirohydrochlorin ferrochelatase